MPSLQALPSELISHIVQVLIEEDITSAFHLLQTCKVLKLSKDYDKVRYLYSWLKSGFPHRERLPRHPRQEADLLQLQRWPQYLKRVKSSQATSLEAPRLHHQWLQVPTSIQTATSKMALSKKARLIDDCIYDVTVDGSSLCIFNIERCQDSKEATLDENLLIVTPLNDSKILSYDVDVNQNVLVLLLSTSTGLALNVRCLEEAGKVLVEAILPNLQASMDITEVVVNGSSILVSVGNNLHIWKWSEEEGIQRIWSRSQSSVANTNQASGWYVRGSLLSADVVACIVLYTYRTIGSMRVSQGVMELYRLDQYSPKVADITLSEISVDALQPRYLQDPYSYINVDTGGRGVLTEYQSIGTDRPVIIQTFGETRLGNISSLADVLYPKAALALYSEAHPVLGREWLRGNFPLLSGVSPLQSSLHGNKMLSCSKRGKNELIYWNVTLEQISTATAEASAREDIGEAVSHLCTSDDTTFHIDLVSVDGPRALLTCFRCDQGFNGTMYATEPIASFWTDLQPRPH